MGLWHDELRCGHDARSHRSIAIDLNTPSTAEHYEKPQRTSPELTPLILPPPYAPSFLSNMATSFVETQSTKSTSKSPVRRLSEGVAYLGAALSRALSHDGTEKGTVGGECPMKVKKATPSGPFGRSWRVVGGDIVLPSWLRPMTPTASS